MFDSPVSILSATVSMAAQKQSWQELESQRRRETELRQKMHKYENGEKGSLYPMFSGVMMDWMEFLHTIGKS